MKFLIPLLAVVFLHLEVQQKAYAQLGRLFGNDAIIETIETKQLQELLKKEETAGNTDEKTGALNGTSDFVLVDVRSDSEMNVSIIPGAITKAHYEKNPQLYKDKTAIVYCTVGGRSSAYAKQLAGNGIKVKNYKGSILEWVGAELPLQTLDGQSTNRVHTSSSRYRVPAKYEQVTK